MSLQTMMTTISERIDEWGLRTSKAVCYEYQDQTLTYGELKNKSDALAYFLQDEYRHIDKERPVLVYGHMDPLMLICFISANKTGRAYIPVDTSMPAERIQQIIEAANPILFLATTDLPQDLTIPSSVEMFPERALQNLIHIYHMQTPDPKLFVQNDDNHYIIYTSGSTGMPKGVQISQNNLISFTNWLLQDFSFQEGMRILNQAPYSFDLSVMDLYPALLSGGTLVPLDKTISANLKKLYQTIPKLHLNVWVSTPSFIDVCLLDADFNHENNPDLINFLFCGEILTKETARELLRRFPTANIYNTYGPTEATVAVTQIKITEELIERYPSLPIGQVKPDTELIIVDETGEAVPDGEKGEIVLIGPSISKGYLHEPDKTAQVFKPHPPFLAYHTGDCGAKIDGHLFFYGRLDFQIKLHGYRIELEDIENHLKEVSYVRQAIVVPKTRDGKVDCLVAFVTPHEHSFQKEYQLSSAIKKELQDKMPTYMIPRKWIYTEQLPLTANGKIDRKKLAAEVNE